MYYQSQVTTIAQSVEDALLGALGTVPGGALLLTPKVHLFTSIAAPINPNSATTDFTEATFTGYALIALPTAVGPVNLPGQKGRGMLYSVTFVAGSLTPPGQNIQGYWVDNGTSTFYFGETFPAQIPIALPGDFLNIDIVFPIQSPGAVA